MRPLALIFSLSLPLVAGAQTARGDRITVAPAGAPTTPRIGHIPETGYAHIDRVALPQFVRTPLAALSPDRFAIGLEGPVRVGVLDAAGHLDPAHMEPGGRPDPTYVIDENITAPLLVTPRGMIVASGAERSYLVTPDGAVRNAVSVINRNPLNIAVRRDGSLVMISSRPNAREHEMVVVSADGERAESRLLSADAHARPVVDARGDTLVSFGPYLGSTRGADGA